MKWDSPWGKSYPGWHIECSAMGRKYLGENFDIHTGGVDHIPIHHENEIAQCKGAFGHNPAKTWMHCEFLLVDGGKMSKSLGNIYTIKDLQEKGTEPLAYKLFCYSSHYRNKLNFTFEGVKSAQTSLNRLREGYLKNLEADGDISDEKIAEYENRFHEAINDDLNMPLAMGVVWEVIRNEVKSKKFATLLEKFDEVLGLDIKNSSQYSNKEIEIPNEIQQLIEQRNQAKAEKNWEQADKIRDEIKEKGYKILEKKNGVKVEKI